MSELKLMTLEHRWGLAKEQRPDRRTLPTHGGDLVSLRSIYLGVESIPGETMKSIRRDKPFIVVSLHEQ